MTTKERREMTSSVISQEKQIQDTRKGSNFIDATYGVKIQEDTSNREVFLRLNAILTGLPFEYKFLTGFYHPQLEETKYEYVWATSTTTFETKYFYDASRVRAAGNLEEGNEFHLNLDDRTTAFLPIRPEKYAGWENDLHETVSIWKPTELELFSAIPTMMEMFENGGTTGLVELTVFGEYLEFKPDTVSDIFINVSFADYSTGIGNFMDDGYDPIGDLVVVNSTDVDNFLFGIITKAETEPSRISISTIYKKGEIPENANITTTFTAGNVILQEICENTLYYLEENYNTMLRFLELNGDNNLTANVDMKDNLQEVLSLIDGWRETKDFSNLETVVTNIDTKRNEIAQDRVDFINTYLPTMTEKYNDRFKILEIRLSKRAGSCREYMKIKSGIQIITEITDTKEEEIGFLKKFFITRQCKLDGDMKRRLFIEDDGDFQVGDEVFILTDNESIPEIRAIIDIIVDARLQDVYNTKVDEDTGIVDKAYFPVKKIFFKDAWLSGKVKVKRFFPESYKVSEGFRLIKEISN